MIKFYLIIGIELLFSPFLYIWEEIKKITGKYAVDPSYKINKHVLDNEVIFAVHEWAGYHFVREKTIKYVNHKFSCGLKYHFDRLSVYNGAYTIKKILTVSECNDAYIEKLKGTEFYTDGFEVHPVVNNAMDFSGYSFVCEKLLDQNKDQIVFLTNTSIDSALTSFIDEYIQLFKDQPELGLLGISYSTKIYQTFIRNNFRPHLQSFFLMSRSSVLKELLESNGGHLPGATETYKLSIIRFGEVKITEMVQKLGYKVAVITEDGEFKVIPRNGFYYNKYKEWTLPMNDYRLHVKHPNRINPLKANYEI